MMSTYRLSVIFATATSVVESILQVPKKSRKINYNGTVYKGLLFVGTTVGVEHSGNDTLAVYEKLKKTWHNDFQVEKTEKRCFDYFFLDIVQWCNSEEHSTVVRDTD